MRRLASSVGADSELQPGRRKRDKTTKIEIKRFKESAFHLTEKGFGIQYFNGMTVKFQYTLITESA